MSEANTRQFEIRVEIEASPDEVWRALTDAEELMRWFPLEARVKPGVGGSVRLSWGGGWDQESRIEIWDPPRRLRMVDAIARPYDIAGKPIAEGAPLPVAIDYQLEGAGGGTVLRLVHSGFGAGQEWDDEVEGVGRGWTAELAGLRHYMARHRGRARRVAWLRVASAQPVERSWSLLSGELGLARRAGSDRYTMGMVDGQPLAGRVLDWAPPWGFLGTVEGLDDGLLRLAIETVQRNVSVGVFLSTWGVAAERVEAFRGRASARLAALFGAPPIALP